MQSGRANARSWVLEFEPWGHRWIEPLMGWSASDDPFSVVRLTFPTLAAAVDYAEQEGLDYRVIEPPAKRLVPKDYRETIVGPGFHDSGSGPLWAKTPVSGKRSSRLSSHARSSLSKWR
jgi:hypothetical protein